ncbi:hypothetical protein SAMN05216464_11957 [Mucilaginibacter pineti]|uniref:Collagen triple helix repeat-containing protein n=1 Tax=Mucilaginibacter pineti TaxID=1391627 RepID=A0A1G7LPC9_9SPHI|nr:collagen-like protein [Mucilaginibacter pineti]SDF51251.1 hypothetical protein SAMN05216464_11957 [Mucilaginibacter pineti]
MKKQICNLVFILAMATFAASCGKDGAVGPQGDKGEQGVKGTTGDTGVAGPKGATGNANVKIDTFTVKNEAWLYNSTYYVATAPNTSSGYFSRYYDRANTLLTQSFLNDNGIVMVYYQSTPGFYKDQWLPLPYSFYNGIGKYALNFAYQTDVGKVRLHFFFSNAATTSPQLNTYNIPTLRFKVVALTGTIVTGMKKSNINLNSYTDVSNYLNLKQ